MGKLAETVAGFVLVRQHYDINSEEHTVSPEQWEKEGSSGRFVAENLEPNKIRKLFVCTSLVISQTTLMSCHHFIQSTTSLKLNIYILPCFLSLSLSLSLSLYHSHSCFIISLKNFAKLLSWFSYTK